MKPLETSEVPKHRKRSPKKRHIVRWTFTGDKSKVDKLMQFMIKDHDERFATERAAKQALEAWQSGRGNGIYVYPHASWAASYIPPSSPR